MGRMVWVPQVSGPLAPYAAGFSSWLASRAYSLSAAADRLYQFDQLSRWLAREGLGVGELSGGQAERVGGTGSGLRTAIVVAIPAPGGAGRGAAGVGGALGRRSARSHAAPRPRPCRGGSGSSRSSPN
jgi:hypothetical protein